MTNDTVRMWDVHRKLTMGENMPMYEAYRVCQAQLDELQEEMSAMWKEVHKVKNLIRRAYRFRDEDASKNFFTFVAQENL